MKARDVKVSAVVTIKPTVSVEGSRRCTWNDGSAEWVS
jgi:hypothetical protein